MSIKIEKKWIVYESVTLNPIIPAYVLNLDKVKEYINNNPFPETEDYTKEDLLFDVQSDGIWTLGDYVTEEQREYIREMVQTLL
jgi:hypothetical protein